MSRLHAIWAQVRPGLTRKHWAWATGLGLLLGILVPLQTLHINYTYTLGKILTQTPIYLAFDWVFLLAIAIADAWPVRDGQRSTWRYIAAAVAASMIGVAFSMAMSGFLPMAPTRVISGISGSTPERFYTEQHRTNSAVVAIGFEGVVHGWFATFIYLGLRNSRRAARALAQAELERSETSRALLASQLEAVHAEVDPAIVFAELEAIEGAYDVDPAKADRRLDELIARLRAAIPKLRSEELAAAGT